MTIKLPILILAGLSLFWATGCTQHRIPTVEGTQVDRTQTSLAGDGVVSGGVDSAGKYTGSDGVSRSGFRLLYFGYNSYRLDSGQVQRVLSDLPKVQRAVQHSSLRIEGNCDEFGTDEYNYALGLKRAKAVKAILVNNGIPAAKIAVVSYGESNPVCRGSNPACHAKNRRAEINTVP